MIAVIKKAFSLVLCVLTSLVALLSVPKDVTLEPITSDDAIKAGKYTVFFDTEKGSFSVAKNETTIFEDAAIAYTVDEKTVRSTDYGSFDVSEEAINGGKKVTVNMKGDGLNDLTQVFCLYNEKDYFTVQTSIHSNGKEVKTNYIAPLLIENGKIQNSDTLRWKKSLEVPFDNDGWAEFKVKHLIQDSVSYEVGALFAADNGNGFIMGSLNHDIWKSGVRFTGTYGKIKTAELYCGATDPRTGNEPHGTVTGETVKSPTMFVGVYDNWKDGMNEFGDANTAIQPKRKSVTDNVPLGWNSWGSVQTDLSYDTAVGISQYVKDNLQPVWQGDDNNNIYINLDSWWDLLSDEELKKFADYCHANNQKAGIYWSPFVCWLNEDDMKIYSIAGTDVKYEDARLKKSDGTYYGNEVDGCYPLDVTHPAVKKQAEQMIGRFKAAGFDYIKLDFLVHASFEGDFYNKDITTGIQAYNYAMSYLTDLIGDDMFINLAMSPTFPYQYANGRRLACDSYYHIGETEYTLNSVTYGFWEQRIYDYTDPDHIVVWGKDAGATAQEARSRVTSGVISGTSFLAGDNFVNPNGNTEEAQKRFIEMLGNEDVMRVAKIGKIFNPVITNTSNKTANIFTLENDGKLYLAVINYNKIWRSFKVDLGGGQYTAKELWSGTTKDVSGTLWVNLDPKDAAIYELTPKG